MYIQAMACVYKVITYSHMQSYTVRKRQYAIWDPRKLPIGVGRVCVCVCVYRAYPDGQGANMDGIRS